MQQPRLTALTCAVAAALALAAAQASAGTITLYEDAGFRGHSMSTVEPLTNVARSPFRELASSAVVNDGAWEVCTDTEFRGRCARLTPGSYAALSRQLDGRVVSVREVPYGSDAVRVSIAPDSPPLAAAAVVAPPVIEPPRVVLHESAPPPVIPGRAVLYQNPNFAGAKAAIDADRAPDLDWAHFTNPASSVRIEAGNWLMCSQIGYQGDCRVLGPGEYPTLTGLFANGIYSAREVYPPQYGSAEVYYRR
jgi:hypothetical protein